MCLVKSEEPQTNTVSVETRRAYVDFRLSPAQSGLAVRRKWKTHYSRRELGLMTKENCPCGALKPSLALPGTRLRQTIVAAKPIAQRSHYARHLTPLGELLLPNCRAVDFYWKWHKSRERHLSLKVIDDVNLHFHYQHLSRLKMVYRDLLPMQTGGSLPLPVASPGN